MLIRTSPLLLVLASCNSTVTVEPVLQIISISPTGGAANVNVDSNILVTFNAALNTSALNTEDAYLLDANEELVVADLLYAEERWTLTLDPVEDLEKASNYTLVLTSNLGSDEKGALLQEVRSTFRTTGEDPQNSKPIADPGGAQYFQVGGAAEGILMNASNSYDPEGAPLTYSWSMDSQPSGSSASLSSTTDIEVGFTPDEIGEYLVRLVVNDGTFDSDPTYAVITAGTEAPSGGEDTGGEDTGSEDTGGEDTGEEESED